MRGHNRFDAAAGRVFWNRPVSLAVASASRSARFGGKEGVNPARSDLTICTSILNACNCPTLQHQRLCIRNQRLLCSAFGSVDRVARRVGHDRDILLSRVELSLVFPCAADPWADIITPNCMSFDIATRRGVNLLNHAVIGFRATLQLPSCGCQKEQTRCATSALRLFIVGTAVARQIPANQGREQRDQYKSQQSRRRLRAPNPLKARQNRGSGSTAFQRRRAEGRQGCLARQAMKDGKSVTQASTSRATWSPDSDNPLASSNTWLLAAELQGERYDRYNLTPLRRLRFG